LISLSAIDLGALLALAFAAGIATAVAIDRVAALVAKRRGELP
jgi:ABC-type nickel/cobalt efflux system permease component RcnA